MRLTYNVTGAQRKSLAGAISQELNAPTQYLGAPTFTYEVGGYHIDKNGTVTGMDNLDLEDALHQKGFDAEKREYDEPDTYESGLGGMGALDEVPDIDQHHPGQYANPNAPITDAMQSQLDEVSAFEELRMDGREELGLGRTRREDPQGESGMQASDVPAPEILAIEMPLTGFTPEKLENLVRLVNAKAPLLKAALGVNDLPVQQTDEDGGKLVFPWFTGDADGDAVQAYSILVERLCAAAKEKQRVTAKEREVDNPKYAMRCWLLSLGLIGDEYKNTRKLLLSRLDGNSSFKGGSRPTYTVHCYTSPNGSEEDAMDCNTFEFTSLVKAKAKCDELAAECESLKYAGAHVEDNHGKYLYEILADGTVNQ